MAVAGKTMGCGSGRPKSLILGFPEVQTVSKQILIGGADLVGITEITELVAKHRGPCVSIFLHTHRSGPGTQQDPTLLGELLDDASTQLTLFGFGQDQIEEILTPLFALIDNGEFWKYPADGLALYAAPSFHRHFRVQIPLEESLTVGQTFRVRPLLPLLTGDSRFFLLALSQNQVKLYEATKSTIAELSLGPIPASMADALMGEKFQRQLQFRSVSKTTVQYFGSGSAGEVEKQSVERFLRLVDHGLVQRLGNSTHPLVLAAVEYYPPLFREMSKYPHIVEGSIEGNPNHRSPVELHTEAWPLVKPYLEAARRQALDRLREAPTTRVATIVTDLVASAMEGGIDTLLIAPGPQVWGTVDPSSGVVEEVDEPSSDTEDLLERVVADTLLNDGKVYSVDASELPETSAAAILRF